MILLPSELEGICGHSDVLFWPPTTICIYTQIILNINIKYILIYISYNNIYIYLNVYTPTANIAQSYQINQK